MIQKLLITFYISLICILCKTHLGQNLLIEESSLVFGYKHIDGISSVTILDTFWSNKPDLCVPFASNAMPRNWFAEILLHLHVNDNLLMPRGNTDCLYILHQLIESLNNHCVKLHNISKQVSTDESMTLFKGRSSLKQYNPMKPIKRGYKLWVRAGVDGYISKFDVYQGRNTTPKN